MAPVDPTKKTPVLLVNPITSGSVGNTAQNNSGPTMSEDDRIKARAAHAASILPSAISNSSQLACNPSSQNSGNHSIATGIYA